MGAVRQGSAFYWKSPGQTTPVTYTNWAPREPNNLRNSEDCAEIVTDTKWWPVSGGLVGLLGYVKIPVGKWNDCSCDEGKFSVCEMDA